ncbi:hypothetical protein J6590_063043 [Homalodisca vitripennis]|nr:hypothetical protein J6590_063043 [Homalodisca vitripennis]
MEKRVDTVPVQDYARWRAANPTSFWTSKRAGDRLPSLLPPVFTQDADGEVVPRPLLAQNNIANLLDSSGCARARPLDKHAAARCDDVRVPVILPSPSAAGRI